METAQQADPLRLWVLTDGRAGNEAQALGLAEAIGRARPAEIDVKRIELKPWAARMPAWLIHRLARLSRAWPFLCLIDGGAEIRAPWPDCVIGAGRRAAPVVAALRQRHGVTAIQLLDPKMPADAFDALITPSHDRVQGANILTTIGALSRVTPERIAEDGRRLKEQVRLPPAPRIAVLIGGPSGSATFGESDVRALQSALETLAETHGLIVTTSRRSPEGLAHDLSRRLGDRALVWGPGDDGPNLYPGMLGQVSCVLVTEDSVNMASEAASTGLPVHVFPLSKVAPKITQFHQDLNARGASRRFTGTPESWTYEPLAEADRITQDLIRRGLI